MPTAMQNAKKKKLTRATYMNRIVHKTSAEKEELGPRARDTQLLLQHDRHQNRKKKKEKKSRGNSTQRGRERIGLSVSLLISWEIGYIFLP